jgi:predicted ATPase
MTQQTKNGAGLSNLPSQFTPFIGRRQELVEITALLTDPACRLLTLLGPGGIGKTRLALQAATATQPEFRHGVYFVPLHPPQSVDFLAATVADTLKFPLTGAEDLTQQLLNYLRDKNLLLILDNFEQLLVEQGETLLTDILVTAPALKLLVTSRQVLNLQEEWLYRLQGMQVPAFSARTPATEFSVVPEHDLESYSAIQLFVERVRRVRRGAARDGHAAALCRQPSPGDRGA